MFALVSPEWATRKIKAHTQSDSPGGSTDMTPWHTIKLTHRGSTAPGAESDIDDFLVVYVTSTAKSYNINVVTVITDHWRRIY